MSYDYIIVGGGSAGCVLANRLSADPANRVCLVEAGGDDRSSLVYTPLPSLVATVSAGLFNWKYNSKPQPTMANREIYCPRGKVLGGSSSINAMVYTRGQRQDYDSWAAQGNDGWSYDDVLPYFKRSEHNERGGCDYHGTGGPLNVADLRSKHPICEAFIQAAVEKGERPTDDFNGAEQEGVGWYQTTQKEGRRFSAAAAYLHPVSHRPNLDIMTDTQTTRVLLEGMRAVGIEVLQEGARRQIMAEKEVILSAGAYGSPQILLLSGIGPREKVEPHGIAHSHELPGVGENLQEHVDIIVVGHDKSASSWAMFRPRGFVYTLYSFFRYILHKQGMLTSPNTEAGAFIKVSDHAETPDIQIHTAPLAMDDHGRYLPYYAQYGFSVHACVLRPKSRGHLSLRDSDPASHPEIDPNLLSHPDDTQLLIQAVRRLREYFAADALKAYFDKEINPGNNVASDQALEEFIRSNANHVYHPVGTCKMGSDPMAVVNEQLCVHGIEQLRVVDASIMPTIISGNTNAPTMMIAEKAADMILSANEL